MNRLVADILVDHATAALQGRADVVDELVHQLKESGGPDALGDCGGASQIDEQEGPLLLAWRVIAPQEEIAEHAGPDQAVQGQTQDHREPDREGEQDGPPDVAVREQFTPGAREPMIRELRRDEDPSAPEREPDGDETGKGPAPEADAERAVHVEQLEGENRQPDHGGGTDRGVGDVPGKAGVQGRTEQHADHEGRRQGHAHQAQAGHEGVSAHRLRDRARKCWQPKSPRWDAFRGRLRMVGPQVNDVAHPGGELPRVLRGSHLSGTWCDEDLDKMLPGASGPSDPREAPDTLTRDADSGR